MIEVQKEEMLLWKEDAVATWRAQEWEKSFESAERNMTKMLFKLVDKSCPDMDPTKLFPMRTNWMKLTLPLRKINRTLGYSKLEMSFAVCSILSLDRLVLLVLSGSLTHLKYSFLST